MEDDGGSDDSGDDEPRVVARAAPSKNTLATAPLFWMRAPIVLPPSDVPAEAAGDLERMVDPRIASALVGMGVDSLFSVQSAVLDAFKVRDCL